MPLCWRPSLTRRTHPMGKFETKLEHSNRWHQPVRVPSNKDGIFGAAKELAEFLREMARIQEDNTKSHLKMVKQVLY